MSESVTNYEKSELSLRTTLEAYRQNTVSLLETYACYGLDGSEEAAKIREEQKRFFIDGYQRNPQLNYPVLEGDGVESLHAQMERYTLDLMRDSTEVAHDPDRETALYDILRIRRIEIGMLEISRVLNAEELSITEKQKLVDLFNRANDEVHGDIEEKRFNGLLYQVQDKAHKALESEVPELVTEAAEYILQNTKEVSAENSVFPVEVRNEQLEAVRTFVEEKFADLLACIPQKINPEEPYSVEELAEIFRASHAVRNTGWSVRVEIGKKNVDTRQNESTTVVGGKRKLPTFDEARALVVHENGVHVERRKRGDASGDPLLSGTGLPGYLDAEEGLAKILEQVLSGEQSESGIQYYTAIGLARGMDGSARRDFRDVYELELRRRILDEYDKKGKISDERVEKLKSLAYNTCERIFRGTPCDLPGMVYTKDQAYFAGNQKMWELVLGIMNHSEPNKSKKFDALFAAKYDPTNPLHVRLVEKVLE